MKKTGLCAGLSVCLLSGCASVVAVLGQGQVEASARRHCEQMPSMEQRNQCWQAHDTTAPKDLRPRMSRLTESQANGPGQDIEQQRRDALCIRREGQAPLCPN